MEDEDEEQTKIIEMICETEGCGNAGIPIRLEVPETIRASFCGVCGQRIENVVDVPSDAPPLPPLPPPPGGYDPGPEDGEETPA